MFNEEEYIKSEEILNEYYSSLFDQADTLDQQLLEVEKMESFYLQQKQKLISDEQIMESFQNKINYLQNESKDKLQQLNQQMQLIDIINKIQQLFDFSEQQISKLHLLYTEYDKQLFDKVVLLIQSEQFGQLIKFKHFDPKITSLVSQITLLKKTLKQNLSQLFSQGQIVEIHSKLNYIQLNKTLQQVFDDKDDLLDQLLDNQLTQQMTYYFYPLQYQPKLFEDLPLLAQNLLQNKRFKTDLDSIQIPAHFQERFQQNSPLTFANSFMFDSNFNGRGDLRRPLEIPDEPRRAAFSLLQKTNLQEFLGCRIFPEQLFFKAVNVVQFFLTQEFPLYREVNPRIRFCWGVFEQFLNQLVLDWAGCVNLLSQQNLIYENVQDEGLVKLIGKFLQGCSQKLLGMVPKMLQGCSTGRINAQITQLAQIYQIQVRQGEAKLIGSAVVDDFYIIGVRLGLMVKSLQKLTGSFKELAETVFNDVQGIIAEIVKVYDKDYKLDAGKIINNFCKKIFL